MRGIIASIYVDTDKSLEECKALYKDFYSEDPFTHMVATNPHVKQIVKTNNGLDFLQKLGNKLHVIAIIDNFAKA